MVTQSARLPNVRKSFVPDAGYMLVDVDLSGADAQVVAWEAEDEDLKTAFRNGIKIHAHNARTMQPELKDLSDAEIKSLPAKPGELKTYDVYKRGVHATNYYGTARGLAPKLKWSVTRTVLFQEKWFEIHPGVKDWHDRTRRHLDGRQCWNCNSYNRRAGACSDCGAILGRTIKNAFDYSITYYEPPTDQLLRKALAWIPQSTVALLTRYAMFLLEDKYPFVQVLLQVHDSLIFQLPIELSNELNNIMEDLNKLKVPYKDPLFIPWGAKSGNTNWGSLQ